MQMLKPNPITRRRALCILGAAAGLALPGTATPLAGPIQEWRGRALGGPARISIRDGDTARIERLLAHCVAEIERLENIFSMYRPESELCRLNREGRLDAPSLDLRLLLAESRRFGVLSGGAFDVTVQPLWQLYAAHFAANPGTADGPADRDLAAATAMVDYRAIDSDGVAIRLTRPGMAVTLNGIAQGYLTDRISDMLRDAGLTGVLVDLGEIRASAGESWRIGVEDPRRPGAIAAELPLAGGALATSGGYGTRFDAAGRFHHLFDPASGRSAGRVLAASAFAPTATVADALATTLAVAPVDRARALVLAFGGSGARLALPHPDMRIMHI